MKKAVQIGSGNIGRGLNGYLLSKNDYHISFLDVSQEAIDKLNSVDEYHVIQKGPKYKIDIVSNFNAYNIINEKESCISAIADADVVLISIGISNLINLKPLLLEVFKRRLKNNNKNLINIIAVENGINATDVLSGALFENIDLEIKKHIQETTSFVNCAVDRIVPDQSTDSINVEVEPFFELVLDSNTWKGPKLKEVNYSHSLDKYIQRKLFMLNATHAYIAWFNIKNNIEYIHEFVDNNVIKKNVYELLSTFAEILSRKFDFSKQELESYAKKIFERLSNFEIQDKSKRVGRGVKRKISKSDRFIMPIKYAKEFKVEYNVIIKALAYAFSNLQFDDQEVNEVNNYIESHSLLKAIKHFTSLDDIDANKVKDEVEKIL